MRNAFQKFGNPFSTILSLHQNSEPNRVEKGVANSSFLILYTISVTAWIEFRYRNLITNNTPSVPLILLHLSQRALTLEL